MLAIENKTLKFIVFRVIAGCNTKCFRNEVPVSIQIKNFKQKRIKLWITPCSNFRIVRSEIRTV